jgi:hypothetical protein
MNPVRTGILLVRNFSADLLSADLALRQGSAYAAAAFVVGQSDENTSTMDGSMRQDGKDFFCVLFGYSLPE